ncbi:MAG: EAL domain-containing protein [Gammaproteobacteria bacterium]|nr:EAL domain-containing protein [Gammaproteobacteria bacterium]
MLLADRLRHAMAQALRRHSKLQVVFLDLDGFKAVNDKYGHEAGDQLLVALSSRMRHALRDGDTLARLGGDEFVAVLVDLADPADSAPILDRLLAAAAEPVKVGYANVQVSASLGVTHYPQSVEVDADQLLRQADQAMYQAKLAGKNRYHIYDVEQDRSFRGQYASQERIRRALADGELVLYYQPTVNLRSGEVLGAKALVHWRHPERGTLPLSVFLPAIQDTTLALEIGEWMIDTALADLGRWRAEGLAISVSVNVGVHQLLQPEFMDQLRQILGRHPDVKPEWLELEILENSVLEDVGHVSHVVAACRDIGVQCALDDFGAGYTSLSYLRRLPVDLIKIDQTFVRGMLDDPEDLAILSGIIGMASAFGRRVIVEGVQTPEHGTMNFRSDRKRRVPSRTAYFPD